MPIAPAPGAMTKAHSEDRMPSVGSAIASADLAAGHQGPTVSAAGEACAPVASAVAGLAAASAVSAVEDSAAAGSGVRRPLEGDICRTYLQTTKL